ncbi:MAG TPA: hypothetical protein V6D33_12645 [Cyanophyceae cyanobacterium]
MVWFGRQNNPDDDSDERLQQQEYESWFKSPGEEIPGQQSLWEVTETTRPQAERNQEGGKNSSDDR